VLVALLTASVLFWLQVRLTGDDLAQLMRDLQGERIYSVLQQDQGVGYLRTQTHKDASGNWVMQQQLNINLLNAPAFATRQQLTFAATPPLCLTQRQPYRGNDKSSTNRSPLTQLRTAIAQPCSEVPMLSDAFYRGNSAWAINSV
jgi:hypothetical protein